MKDIMGMMKQAQELGARMSEMQERLAQTIVEGRAGAGLVSVRLSGKGELKGISIDPSLLKAEEGEILEDLIIAAHADAKAKSDEEMAKKMGEMTAGMPLPPGMKFPF